MAGARPNRIGTSALKAKFMNLAQTSQFVVKFQPPNAVSKMLLARGLNYRDESGFLELLCNETSLPGSTLATHDKTNDYMGVTEKLAYRRIYDETLDMTFYVDKKYKIIQFFEGWIDYISGVGTNGGNFADFKNTQVGFRNNFPDTYKTNIYISKFEKDLSDRALYHTFVDAFPIAINNIPISYETSDVMRFSVSFSYVRYVREYLNFNSTGSLPLGNPDRNTALQDPNSAVLDGLREQGSATVSSPFGSSVTFFDGDDGQLDF